MRVLLVAAVVLVLSGCLSGPQSKGPSLLSTPWTFSDVLVGPGGDAETSVTAGPGGLVLACSHGGFGKPSPSWVSQDGGATWRALDPQPNPVVSGDCDWAVADDGTWAIVYDTIASATVASTRDGGESWAFDYGSAVPFGGVDRPWIAADGTTLYLAYANVMAEEPAVNTLAISRDGGRTWTEHHVAHTVTAEESDRPQTVIGHPIVHDGTIRIPLASADLAKGGPTWLTFAVSRDDGNSWTEEPVAGPYPSSFQLPSADLAPDGTLYAVKDEGQAGHIDVTVLVSRDDGQTWSEIPVATDVSFPSVSSAWIDARPDGTATVAWMQDDGHGRAGTWNRTVWAARVSADGLVREARALTQPVLDGSLFEFIMVDHDAAGRAVVVYPMDTGPDCHKPAPTAQGRSQQCVRALVESLG